MDILDALQPSETTIRHITTRHEQGAAFMADVHGRLTGRAAVAMATLGPGRDEPRHGHRRRLPRSRADGRDHRPGGLRQAPQGGAPVRRHRPDVRAGDEVEPARRAGRARSPRSSARRSASPSSRSPARPTSSCPRTSPARAGRRTASARSSRATTYFPEPTDEAIAHAAEPHRRRRSGRSSWPATASSGGARRAELRAFAKRPPRPGRGDVHGQGRDRRPLAPVADGGRAPGARPRPVRASTGRTSSSASATTSSSTRRRAGTRTAASGSSTSTRSRPRSTRTTGPRSSSSATSSGTLRRLLAAVAAPWDRRPRRRASGTRPRETLVHADLRTALLARARGPSSDDDGWPIKPQRAIADLRRALGPDDIVVSATSARTRSGSPASTRRTSRTR